MSYFRRCECSAGGGGWRVAAAAARGAGAVQLRGAPQHFGRRHRGSPSAALRVTPTHWCVFANCSALLEPHYHPVTYPPLSLVEIETPRTAPHLVATVAEMVVRTGADFCIPCVAADHPPPHYAYTEIDTTINSFPI